MHVLDYKSCICNLREDNSSKADKMSVPKICLRFLPLYIMLLVYPYQHKLIMLATIGRVFKCESLKMVDCEFFPRWQSFKMQYKI